MPNWCQNRLIIEGKDEDIAEFLDKVVDWDVDEEFERRYGRDYMIRILETIIPCPEELENIICPTHICKDKKEIEELKNKKEYIHDGEGKTRYLTQKEADRLTLMYGAYNWYDWQLKHWGTKWGDCQTRMMEEAPGKLELRFDTPWGPPAEGMLYVSLVYPKLSFNLQWVEHGMEFAGEATIEDGSVSQEDVDYCEACDWEWADDDYF